MHWIGMETHDHVEWRHGVRQRLATTLCKAMLQQDKTKVPNTAARKPNNTVLAVHGNMQCG
eukprot:3132618-Lingulodinium_polyedra.AAC.1